MDGEVEELLNGINNRVYLPGLQREFVWKPKQIERLFDSLVREYPVGIITIWKTRSGSVDNYTTYNFLKFYVASDHQPPNEIPDRFTSYNKIEERNDPEFLIIDGQQRLNSLYIGVCGEITEYAGGQGRSSENVSNWQASTLCVDLFGHPNHSEREDIRGDYEFEFRSTGRLGGQDNTGYEKRAGTHSLWVPVNDFWKENKDGSNQAVESGEFRSEIIDPYMNAAPIARNIIDMEGTDLNTVCYDVATDIYSSILNTELDTNSIKKEGTHIPEIFQRLNREGEDPKPYQLFMSQLMSYWPYLNQNVINPREKIRGWVQEFKRNYPEYERYINRRLFIRYSTYLINKDLLHSKMKSISKDDMDVLHKKWTNNKPVSDATCYLRFKNSLEKAFETIIRSGLRDKVLKTMPVFCLLAVFYYEYEEAEVEDNLNEVFYFVCKSLLLNQAGYSAVLNFAKCRNYRRYIYNWNPPNDGPIKFPGDELLENEGFTISGQDVERAVEHSKYESDGEGRVFKNNSVVSILGLITEAYTGDDISNYAVDHIYPRSKRKEIDEAADGEVDLNRIGNLQLLPRTANKEKADRLPGDWIQNQRAETRSRLKDINLYPEVPLKKQNAAMFIQQREKKIIKYLLENYVEDTYASE